MHTYRNFQIARLSIRGIKEDTPALRASFGNIFNSIELKPRGISPSSILVVRRLSDPLPLGLATDKGVVRINGDWERSVQDALADLYGRASRPGQGLILGEPEAVLFADEAELLACLALDASQGNAWAHWWWQTILRSMPPSQGRSSWVRSALCHRALYIPAAISLLHQWGKILSVVNTMTSTDTVAVVQAMADVHGLGQLISGLQAIPHDSPGKQTYQKSLSPSRAARESLREPAADQNIQSAPFLVENKAPIPWHRVVGSIDRDEDFTREQAVLLGLGISLHRAPHVVRRNDFQEEVLDWWLAEDDYSNKTATRVQDLVYSRQQQDQDLLTKLPETIDNQTTDLKTGREGREKYDKKGQLGADQRQRDQGTIIRAAGRQGGQSSGFPPDLVDDQDTSPAEEAILQDSPKYLFNRSSQPFSSLDFGPEGIRTRLGGVLYLINLMQQLKLPACFERDLQLASQLGAWGTLEALARVLLSDADVELLNDPLWSVLTGLDNRQPGVLPGNGLMGANRYRLPAPWWALLPAIEKPAFFWALRKKQLRIWSDFGFVLIDRPEGNNVTKGCLRVALQPYFSSIDSVQILRRSYADAPLNHFRGPWLDGMSSALLDWLALIVPFIRFYLRSTLNLRSENISELSKFVFFHPGELHVTASHVDLIMTLDTISLPIRMAGLDRNPGWLADFGRVMRFYFD